MTLKSFTSNNSQMILYKKKKKHSNSTDSYLYLYRYGICILLQGSRTRILKEKKKKKYLVYGIHFVENLYSSLNIFLLKPIKSVNYVILIVFQREENFIAKQ